MAATTASSTLSKAAAGRRGNRSHCRTEFTAHHRRQRKNSRDAPATHGRERATWRDQRAGAAPVGQLWGLYNELYTLPVRRYDCTTLVHKS